MNPESVKEILDYLLKTGELVLTPVFKLAYKQAIYNGIVDLGFCLLFAIMTFFCFKFMKKAYDDKNNYDRELYLTLSGLFGGLFFLVSLFSLSYGLNNLINTEMCALKILTKMVVPGS